MQFNRVVIENVGNFFGRYEFNLRPSRNCDGQQPIVLFGGLNGAGKTTIFESIKLCLYGAEMLGAISTAKYHDYLREKIHQAKNAAVRPNHALVEIEFEYVSFGKVNTYVVERYWEWTGTRIKESLTVTKNGMAIDDIELENWQDFVKEMIPLGLSQLFFFDGEKIRNMMADDSSEELKNSILALLGLDIVDRLQADLKIYRTRYLKEVSNSDLTDKLTTFVAEIELCQQEITVLKAQKSSLDSQSSDVQARIISYKEKMSAQGEGYFKKRAELEERRRALTAEIERLKENARDVAAGLLPVAIATSCACRLESQIKKENEQNINVLLGTALKKKHREMKEAVTSRAFFDALQLDRLAAEKIRGAVLEQIDQLFATTDETEKVKVLFGLSERQTLDALAILGKAKKEVPTTLRSLSAALEKAFRELEKVTANIERAPDDDFMAPMYETLDILSAELATHLAAKTALEVQINELQLRKTELEKKAAAVSAKMEASLHLTDKLDLVTGVQRALDRYHGELRKQKVTKLEATFSEIFKFLHRKEDMIARVEIDPETCHVSLFNEHGETIRKGGLSSGELEIFAISMLWALAKTSGQRLPFIIDTPLARLDSKHRDNLVNHFFPKAAHQVMIFSTNTEVDQQYFELLRPSLAHSYSLEYDDASKLTLVKGGYFWN
jgi:DNA sulfur modification protein DndD